jgi:hypothetical protein
MEQKWGAIDLKGKTLAEKMAVISDATKGVNEEFAKTREAEVDKAIIGLSNTIDTLGNTILDLLESSGALTLFNKAIGITGAGISTMGAIVNKVRIGIKGLFGQDTTDDMKEHEQRLLSLKETWDKVLGNVSRSPKKFGATATAEIIPDIKGKAKPKEQVQIEQEMELLKQLQKQREEIAKKYVTTALCEKVKAKIEIDNDGFSSKQIPRLLNTVYYDVIKEEIWNFVKEFKNPTINYKTLQHFIFAQVKICVPMLF